MSVTQYVGARYVPLFANPIDWDITKAYEPLTIVYYQGNSYTSKQSVPTGTDINNDTYWALTGSYNAQIEQYRAEVVAATTGADTANATNTTQDAQLAGTTDSGLKTLIGANTTAISAETTRATAADTALDEKIAAETTRVNDEVTARTEADDALSARIVDEISNRNKDNIILSKNINQLNYFNKTSYFSIIGCGNITGFNAQSICVANNIAYLFFSNISDPDIGYVRSVSLNDFTTIIDKQVNSIGHPSNVSYVESDTEHPFYIASSQIKGIRKFNEDFTSYEDVLYDSLQNNCSALAVDPVTKKIYVSDNVNIYLVNGNYIENICEREILKRTSSGQGFSVYNDTFFETSTSLVTWEYDIKTQKTTWGSLSSISADGARCIEEYEGTSFDANGACWCIANVYRPGSSHETAYFFGNLTSGINSNVRIHGLDVIKYAKSNKYNPLYISSLAEIPSLTVSGKIIVANSTITEDVNIFVNNRTIEISNSTINIISIVFIGTCGIHITNDSTLNTSSSVFAFSSTNANILYLSCNGTINATSAVMNSNNYILITHIAPALTLGGVTLVNNSIYCGTTKIYSLT